MTFLNVLGLLGLLSIVALIIIYLIRPNYQQRFVSSTFIWKLSLKYRKKRIPVSRLKNILIIICQILILTCSSLLLAGPWLSSNAPSDYSEKIIIIESSAGMQAMNGHDETSTTRFERAVRQAKALVGDVFAQNGTVSVIFAAIESEMPVRRATAGERDTVMAILDEYECTFGSADVEGAMNLAEEVIYETNHSLNYTPEVVFYTATHYIATGDVTVVDVSEEGEWNAAILNGTASLNGFYSYNFTVDVAVYGKDASVGIGFDIYGANGREDDMITLFKTVTCLNDEPTTVTLNTSENNDDDYSSSEGPDSSVVYTYDYVRVFIASIDSGDMTAGSINDAIAEDNSYYFYGGKKHEIHVQYASSLANPFANTIISSWRQALSADWTIVPHEVARDAEPLMSGFDVYIFEHEMPTTLPDDGLVILLDPDSAPIASGLSINGTYYTSVQRPFYFSSGSIPHPILNSITPENIWVTKYTSIRADETYKELMYCGSDPVLLLKDEPDAKVVVLAVDVNMSNAAMSMDFPLMMLDVFDYFFPATISGHLFEVGDTVSFDSISLSMELTPPDGSMTVYNDFPASYYCDAPGTYTLSQTLLSGRELVTRFYVKMPESESNIARVEDVLVNPYAEQNLSQINGVNLVVYFAAALLALLFVEWWLQSRNQF